ncbi:9109_t:CDS:2, partial [Racocetra persica]
RLEKESKIPFRILRILQTTLVSIQLLLQTQEVTPSTYELHESIITTEQRLQQAHLLNRAHTTQEEIRTAEAIEQKIINNSRYYRSTDEDYTDQLEHLTPEGKIKQVIKTIQLLEIPLLEEKEELTLQNAFENKKYVNLFLFIKEIQELELIQKELQQYLFDNRFTSDDSDNYLAQDTRQRANYIKARLNKYQRTGETINPSYRIDYPSDEY